ncbi:MAG: TonB-dependent receptor [Candidatus Omnitrophica bacterium]|nr:TonB-dependent receptor [Candidatus Omnitrophota bacterium]MBU1808331.1 TonB-dependent receptor [Candidatus Omnitrophota bacterium]
MKTKYIFVLLFILVTNGMAHAEDNSSASTATRLEPIVVTSSRVEKGLSAVAASVSVVTEEEIKRSDAKTVPDALKDLQGIYAYDATGVGAGGTLNMRGFYGGMSSHQLVLVDGIPQNKGKDKLVNWDLIPINNIERIEVMRGPASSLYGDNAMSGVINIITKKPSSAPHAGVFFSYGTYATQNYASYFSGEFNSLGYYMGVSSRLTNGFREHGDYENIQAYGKIDYSINDEHNLKLNFDYSVKTQGAFPWSLSAAQIAQNRRQARPGAENDSTGADKFSMDLTHNWGLGSSSNLETIFYYRFDGMESFYTRGASQNTTREQIEAENTFGLPVRLKTVSEILGMNHSFVIGTDLERNDFDYEQNNAPFQNRRGAPTASYAVVKSMVGPYLQDEIRVLEALKVICGVRYDWIKFNFDDRRLPSNSKNKLMSKVTPSCGVVWAYQKDSELYGNIGRAFRSPTIGQMFTYGSSANINLLPEEAINYEIGVRHRFNERLKTSVSVYWMKVSNEIWYDNASRQYQNYGRTFHDGMELSADFKVADPLTIFGNYTYTRAVDDSDGVLKNKFLVNVPINKGTIGMNIYTELGFKAYVASTWVGKAYIDSANVDVLGHYNTLDAKISYKYKWLEAFVAAYNIFDKEYNSSGYKSARINYFTPEPGRTFEVGVSGEF